MKAEKEKETSIRVVLRTRPTQHFATKNITLDTMENVNLLIKHNLNMIFR